jgi:hypothetical protein
MEGMVSILNSAQKLTKLLLLSIFSLLFVDFANAKYLSPMDFDNEIARYKMLVFLSESCPCSQSHIQHIQDLMVQYNDLKVYGVISEPAQNQKQKLKKDKYFLNTDFGFPIIEDQKQSLVMKYKALKTPHVVLLRQSTLEETQIVYEGGLTDSKTFNSKSKKYIEEAMKDLALGQDVKTKKGFCLGCYIRRY